MRLSHPDLIALSCGFYLEDNENLPYWSSLHVSGMNGFPLIFNRIVYLFASGIKQVFNFCIVSVTFTEYPGITVTVLASYFPFATG
jgi:hypothetical protein